MTFKNTFMAAAFGFIVLGANQAEAAHFYYSTTLDLTKGSYFYFTNNGVVSESFVLNFPNMPNETLSPGDIVSGLILFTNNECLVITNITGTDNEGVSVFFNQTSPPTNVTYGYSVQLLGVSGQPASPNPYSSFTSGTVGSGPLAGVFSLTTSSVSCRGISFLITNEQSNPFGGPDNIRPVNLLVEGANGEISVATSSVPLFNPPLNVLYSFAGLTNSTNSDGAKPFGGLILSGNTLYGTSDNGGASNLGTVFRVNTDGTDFTNLHSFTDANGDGASPVEGSLVLSSNTLFGTATGGGASNQGIVFAINTDGTGFTNLYSFTGQSNGASPEGCLALSSNTLFGVANSGGAASNGSVFAVNTDGSGFTNLHSFTSLTNSTNSDGANPAGGLLLSGNMLYGTAYVGGAFGHGTIYAISMDGSGFTNLYSFSAGTFGIFGDTSTDGLNPQAGLLLSGNTLYGTAHGGGTSAEGAVFAIHTDGTGFTNLHSFTGGSDGAQPFAGLILSGGTLYGTATGGGLFGDATQGNNNTVGNGTLFAVSTNGSNFTSLYSFTGGSDGYYPQGNLVLSGNTLYGCAADGGSSGNGTVFSLSLVPVGAPQLGINLSGANVILTWPTNASGFTLQSATNLVSPVWNTVSPAPVIQGGQNVVTNPVSGAQQFYRLQSN